MTDALDLQAAQIVNAPDVKAWPITTAITQVIFDGSTTRVVFDKQDGPNRWPDVTPPKWEGPLQYTLWLFRKLGDRWVGSAFIQFWHGREASGSATDPDVPSVYHLHWYYDRRWAPLNGSGPIAPGESIGFMVTSGNARDSVGPMSVQERSNIVVFPASDRATYRFPALPAPDPTPTPEPGEDPGGDANVLEVLVALTLQLRQAAEALTVINAGITGLIATVTEIQRVQMRGLQIPYLGLAKPPVEKKNGQA